MSDTSISGSGFPSVEWNPPVKAGAPGPGVPFEIALVQAGAISAGAYTAGAVDFLIEALDTWYQAKDQARQEHGAFYEAWPVPPHDVVLKVITGASAGGMTAAMTAAVARAKFRHIRYRDGGATNPLYAAWVEGVDIRKFLETNDLHPGQPVPSLLDCSILDHLGRMVLEEAGKLEPVDRPWLADPLRVFLTITNVDGVPYWSGMRSINALGYGMKLHKDHVRFVIPGSGQRGTIYPNERVLSGAPSPHDRMWARLIESALASGAFPFFLKPRDVETLVSDYDFRVVVDGPDGCRAAAPWTTGTRPGDPYTFGAVDGGAMDNEPFELARQVLAGARGHNPRDGDEAFRAVICIDPFPDVPAVEGVRAANLDPVNALSKMVSAWTAQARFNPYDLVLADADHVYSRFMLGPHRGKHAFTAPTGEKYHLACGLMGGFGGFFGVDLRRHDYFLGRRNMQQFLRKWFTLPAANALFGHWKNPGLDTLHRVEGERQIIPLVGRMAEDEEVLPTWPKPGAVDLEALVEGAGERAAAVLRVASEPLDVPWYLRPVAWGARKTLVSKIRDVVREKVGGELRSRGH